MSNVSVGDAIRGRVTEIVTVAPGTSLKEAVKLLADRQIGLLVVTENGKVTAVVSLSDLVNHVLFEVEFATLQYV